MKSRKLNQVIASEKEIKQQAMSNVTQAHQISQKPALFNGFYKSYRPLNDDDKEVFPSESQKVQFTVESVLKTLSDNFTELFDVTATKDFANCTAVADVTIDGTVLVKSAPVPFLLFLEKQLDYVKTYIQKLPELDSSQEWYLDTSTGMWKTKITETHRNKKTQRPIVLYDATDNHPAQAQLITEDVLAGFWEKVDISGAIPSTEKKSLLEKLAKLSKAVVEAREEANMSEAPEVKVGQAIFDFLLS